MEEYSNIAIKSLKGIRSHKKVMFYMWIVAGGINLVGGIIVLCIEPGLLAFWQLIGAMLSGMLAAYTKEYITAIDNAIELIECSDRFYAIFNRNKEDYQRISKTRYEAIDILKETQDLLSRIRLDDKQMQTFDKIGEYLMHNKTFHEEIAEAFAKPRRMEVKDN